MKKRFQLIALLAVALLGACSGGKDKVAVEQVDEKPRVKLADVKARPVEQIHEYTATVEAEVKNNIAPSSPVRIDRILVEVGDRVSKGQKLVSMDEANLKQTKFQLDNQEIEFKRMDELYKVGGASKSEWDAAKMALDIKETAYRNLLENTALLSPINGVVTARNYDNGDMYSGGEPVLVVEQIMPVKLLINVSETYFTQVKKGAPVAVKLDVYGDEPFEGYISLVYPTVDPNRMWSSAACSPSMPNMPSTATNAPPARYCAPTSWSPTGRAWWWTTPPTPSPTSCATCLPA